MVSSPEFNYRGSTLTLPAYNIENKIAVSGSRNSIRVDSANDPDLVFPDQDLDNPLEEGNVTVTVKSEYYKGWENFFRDRTTGAIKEVNDEEQKVIFSLEVPKELLLTEGVMYTKGGSVIEGSGGVTVESKGEIEIDHPPTETIVGPEFDKCFPNPGTKPNCVYLTGVSDGSDLDQSKTYYVKSSDTPYSMGEFDAPNANVTILVDGKLEYDQDNFDVGTTSADPVEVYTDGDLEFGGNVQINTAPDTGNASMFITYLNEPYGVYKPGGGTADYTGVIYAPGTNHNGGSCSGSDKINGDLNLKGSLIATNACLKGSAELYYDEKLDLIDLTPDDISLVRYLHITENDIELSS